MRGQALRRNESGRREEGFTLFARLDIDVRSPPQTIGRTMSRPFKTALIAAIVSAAVSGGAAVAATHASASGTTSRVNGAQQARSWKWCHRVKAGTVSFKALCSSGVSSFTWQNQRRTCSPAIARDYRFSPDGAAGRDRGHARRGLRPGGRVLVERADASPRSASAVASRPEPVTQRGTAAATGFRSVPTGGSASLMATACRSTGTSMWRYGRATGSTRKDTRRSKGVGGRFGNYCSPERLWLVDTSP